VNFGREVKRADIVIMDKDRRDAVYILVELKKPKLKDGKEQLRSYCNATGAPIGIWTNGDQITRYQRKDPNFFELIPEIPTANQTLADVLQKSFTLDDLKKLSQEEKQRSLKEVITEMEDEVLANAGVDVFEEVFKLIFTKLYDEWMSGRKGQSGKRQLQFFNSGQTETELKTKIQNLFDAAKKKWQGVFKTTEKIALTGSHLSVCVSYLELRKLFNSNLDVVDEAFEYLINQSSKGEKGQYFTPRYVIDMCVRMLNPKENESMIDPAAGSSGFPVHTMFHVWRQIYLDEGEEPSDMFTAEEKLPRCEDYVEEKVFAIDFDEKAVRVARTLNLIAGDGQTNVLHLNTLDYKRWDEWMDDDWLGIYNNGFRRLRHFQVEKNDYKAFLFDIVMANPPFAGDVKESLMISSYELTKDKAGKTKGVGRDILFVERNLDFLKPGGRMAVVLPQGRFNNSSDKYIRDFIAERCRILAVVGLHGNTFKPHTGTKTSVLLVQKWNDDPKVGALCPRKDDYNIFFATMQKSGKDNSGEKIYVKKSDESGEFLLDGHGHLIVDHDLYNHDGLTQDGIAEAFIEFAKKENLSFFKLSPSVTPFDAVKYQRLMDGLEAVEVEFSKLEQPIRIDAEVYQKIYIQISKAIDKLVHTSIGQEVKTIKKGIFDIKAECYSDFGIPFVRISNLKNMQIDDNDIIYIPEHEHTKNIDTELRRNDVILSKTAYPASSLVTLDICNTSQDTVAIKLKSKSQILSHYLVTFLNSKYGYYQMQRWFTGNIQMHLNLTDCKEIIIPIFNSDFQNHQKNIFEISLLLLEHSKNLYQQAEDLLLSELNLKDWQPTKETIAIKSFKESFLSFGRLDSEYYQPKYEDLLRKLDNCKIELLKDIVSIKKSIEPGSDAYQQDGLPFIRVSNLSKFGITYPEIHISHNLIENIESLKPKKDTILLSKDGSIGIAYKVDNNLEVITSGAILHLKIKKQISILPDYLTLVLNSIIVRLQAERDSGGSIIQHWRVSEIENIVIPVIDITIQENISQKIQMSFTTKKQSKQLLEIAKIGVERAIETDEETATIWINQQLEILGINLKTTT
jgi:type I restriction enzyme M protein